MTGSASACWTLYATLLLGEKFFFRKGEGFRGGDRGRIRLGPGGCRMTGSALRRWTLHITLLLGEKFFL